MEEKKSIVQRFKPKEDWITLSMPIIESNIEAYKPYIRALKKVFMTLDWTTRETVKKVVLESDDIYTCFQPNNFFIQFRGSFMPKHDNPKIIIRLLAIQISNEFNSIERGKKSHENILMISRIDVCIDFINCTPAEIMQPLFSQNNKSCFRYYTSRYSDKNDVETSINIYSSKYSAICYRKDIQLLSEKNLEKKKYYLNLYPPETPITRFELSISGVTQNREASILFYDESCDDDKLCNYILQGFLKTHTVRIINKKNKDSSTWRLDKNWESLFLPNQKLKIPRIKTIKKNDLKISNVIPMNLSRHANAMVDTIEKYGAVNIEETIINTYSKAIVDSNERKIEKDRKKAATKEYLLDLLAKSNEITLASTDTKPDAVKVKGKGKDTNGKKA